MTDLKPCPFCGGKARLGEINCVNSHLIIECRCGICSRYFDELDDAITYWNTRQSAFDWKPIEELKEHTGVLLCEENIYYGGYIFGERLGNKIYINFKGDRIELPINLFTHFAEIEMPTS